MKSSWLSRYILILLSLFIGGTYVVRADEQSLDSLLKELSTLPQNSARVSALIELAWVVEVDGPSAAIVHLDEAIELAKKLGDHTQMAKAHHDKGVMLWYNMGDYNEALENIQQAFWIYSTLGDDEGVANSYHTMASISELRGDLRQALSYHTKSLQIRKEIGDQLGEAWSYINIGVTYSKLGLYDSALICKNHSLKIYEDLGELGGIADVRNNMGIIFFKKGDYNRALDNYLRSLKLKQSLGDHTGMALAYTNIANVFMAQKNLDRALIYYQRAMELRDKSEGKTEMAETYQGMGQIMALQKKMDEAMAFYFQALAIYRNMGHSMGISETLSALSDIYREEGNLDEAIRTRREALATQRSTEDKLGAASTLVSLGNLLKMKQEIPEARGNLEEGLDIASEIGAISLVRDAYKGLGDLFASQKDFKNAYYYQSLHDQIKDSLFNEDKLQAIVDIQTQYDLWEKENEIRQLSQQKKINQLTWVGILTSIVGIIILSLLTMMYIRYRIQTNTNQKLATQKKEFESQNHKLALTNLELEQFAQVVSHDLKQPLRTIANYTGLVERKYQEAFDDRGRGFLNFVSGGVKNLNDLVSDLLQYANLSRQEMEMEMVNMNEVMDNVLFSLRKEIDISQAEIHVGNLPFIYGNKIALTQVFINLVSNAIKFVADDIIPEVSINAFSDQGNPVITVQDNGIGIEPQYFNKIFLAFQRLHTPEEYEGTGIGLAISQKVIHLHHGKIRVESTPGYGSTFFVSLLPPSN